jgi:phage gp46-like protein
MPDIRLLQNNFFPQYSVTVDAAIRDNGMIDDRQALATAVIVALGTDALAERDDILPDPDSTDRAGWWGDLDAEEIWDGWPIGSRLWLLRREAIHDPGYRRGATITRVDRYIREALQPFLDRRIASALEVNVERVGRERIDAHVVMYRGPQIAVDLRFQVLWAQLLEYEEEGG